MQWLTLFLVTVGIGLIGLTESFTLISIGFVIMMIGLLVGYFDITREAIK